MSNLRIMGILMLGATLLGACAAISGLDDFELTGASSTTGSGGGGDAGASSTTGSGGGDDAGGDTYTDAASRLFTYMSGRFYFRAEAELDPDVTSIRVQTCPVVVPMLGERVLYVEWAIPLFQPIRQQILVVEPGDDPATQARWRVFALKDPHAAIGMCAAPGSVSLTSADVMEKYGCAVELTWLSTSEAAHFGGGTVGKACVSTLHGATYATTEVKLTADRLEVWERGYDAMDMQVWGSVTGPSQFMRTTPLPED